MGGEDARTRLDRRVAHNPSSMFVLVRVCGYRRRSGSRQSGVCLPSRASRSAVRSNAIRWSRCSSWSFQTTNSKTWDMSQSKPQTGPTQKGSGIRDQDTRRPASHTSQTGCLNLSVMLSHQAPCSSTQYMTSTYPRDLWQSPLCGGEEVSQRGLQLPVQLQRQVHVHRTLLNHLSETHRHTGVSPQGKDTHSTHTPPKP